MKNKKWILAKQAIFFVFVYFGITFVFMLLEIILSKEHVIHTDYLAYQGAGFIFYMGVLTAFGAFNSIDKKTIVNKIGDIQEEEPEGESEK
jgi:hypothetical protein